MILSLLSKYYQNIQQEVECLIYEQVLSSNINNIFQLSYSIIVINFEALSIKVGVEVEVKV